MLTAEYDYELDIEVQREEAFESGEKSGIEKVNQLYTRLKELGRNEDILRAIGDGDYQKKLLEEFGL